MVNDKPKIYTELLTIRISKEEKRRLDAKVGRGRNKSNILRGLLQMYLTGQIQDIVYTETIKL